MKHPHHLLTVAVLSLGLSLSACASKPQPDRRGGGSGGPSAEAVSGMKMARPIALALTGMAASPDGTIEIAQIAFGASAMFDAFDTDGSGSLSAIEHARWAEAVLGDPYGRPGLRAMDRDGSSTISRDEMVKEFERTARQYDTDSDGVLSRAELLIEMRGRRSQEQSGGQSRGGGRRQGGGGGQGGGGRPPR